MPRPSIACPPQFYTLNATLNAKREAVVRKPSLQAAQAHSWVDHSPDIPFAPPGPKRPRGRENQDEQIRWYAIQISQAPLNVFRFFYNP